MKVKLKYVLPVLLILAMAGIVYALVPPPPANQNIGIYDTKVTNLVEQNCRNCHNSSFLGGVPTRHHNLLSRGVINPSTGAVFGCMDCHPTVTGPNGQSVLIDRNCLTCHNGSNFYANPTKINISRPHHIDTASDGANIGQPAQNRDCKFCHGSFVANYNDGHYIPSYNTSIITPTTHYKIYNATSGRYWGGCFACHQNNSVASPALLDQHDTHHNAINGNRTGVGHQKDSTPGYACNWCHTVNVSSPTGRPVGYPDELQFEIRNSTLLNIGDTLNGTGCEKCHDVGTIHNIEDNYAVNNGNLGFGHIGANWDCNGCHAFWDAGDIGPMTGAIIPDVSSITPSVLAAATDTIVTIEGSNFVGGSGIYTSVVSIDGITTLTPSSVTDTQIVVTVPALTAGSHTIQVVKTGDTLGNKASKLSTLTVVSPVTITSAKLNVKAKVITIVGTGFGTPQQYVTITHAGDIYYSDSINSWSNTLIRAKSTKAIVGDTVTVTTAAGGSASATITKQ